MTSLIALVSVTLPLSRMTLACFLALTLFASAFSAPWVTPCLMAFDASSMSLRACSASFLAEADEDEDDFGADFGVDFGAAFLAVDFLAVDVFAADAGFAAVDFFAAGLDFVVAM